MLNQTKSCPSSPARVKRFYKPLGPKEKRCSWPDCQNFVPAGMYKAGQKYFFCSVGCRKQWFRGHAWGNCAWCGKAIRVRTDNPNIKNHFCCPRHNHLFRSDHLIRGRAGDYMPLLEEYLQTFVATHYRREYGARNALSYFFAFLNLEQIRDLNDVTPKVISRFIAHEKQRGTSPLNYIFYVSTFFDWLISEERRQHANPVVPRIHHSKRPQRLPRPYSEEEIADIWRILDERGNARARLAVAIGEEAGLRIGEVCNIRVNDVDLKKQTIFVRTPNKTMRERTAIFHDKTRRYLAEWLKERNPDCGHDLLLHNSQGRPCTQNALQLEFRRVLCIFERYNLKANETGLATFSFHRLRHLMSSRLAAGGADASVVMKQGGWVTPSAMSGYVRVPENHAIRSYNEAMARARAKRENPTKVVSGFEQYRRPTQPAN